MVDDLDLSEDALLGGSLRFFQPENGYRVAVDPIFLAAAVPAEQGEQILDVGAGSGAAMLCLAARMPSCRLVGIELQRDLLRIANANIEANGFAKRAEMIAGDLAKLPPRLMAASFDHVMTNPPFQSADAGTASPVRQRADAHVEGQLDLTGWLKGCLLMLKSTGCLTIIHRADRLGELLSAIDGKIGDTVVYPLWPKADGRPAKRILIPGVEGCQRAAQARPRVGRARSGWTLLPNRKRRAAHRQGDAVETTAPGAVATGDARTYVDSGIFIAQGEARPCLNRSR